MHGKTRNTLLLGYGLTTDLIDLIDHCGDNVGTLREMPVAELTKRYGEQNAKIIEDNLKRKPIDPVVIKEILRLSGGCCCYCANGNATPPYQLHHIEPYAKTQDNSLANILLVCPTHHVIIHTENIEQADQIRFRTSWYAVREVAEAYEQKGIPFPFGAFEAIPFIGAANPASMFHSLGIGPVTAVAISRHKVGDHIEWLLNKHRFALIAGVSGSGKTTLAVGIAGRLALDGRSVLLHRGRSENGKQMRAEVLTFLKLVARPCVLILDNVQAWASGEELDELANAVPQNASVIVTWSDDDTADDRQALQAHAIGFRVTLTWNAIYESILALLLAHEVEVVEELNRSLIRANEHPLRVGSMGPFLSDRLNSFATKARTAWEFVFLVRAGWSEVEHDLAQMADNSRADVPVLYAAIEQIAAVERPVTPQESATACSNVGAIPGQPEPSADWVRTVFEHATTARRMVRARDAYTTVHREWARALIDKALGDKRTVDQVSRLLARDFDVNTTMPRRLLILLSWLVNCQHGKRFVWNWSIHQTVEGVTYFLSTCAKSSLIDISLACSGLQIRRIDQERDIIAAAIDNNEVAISKAICAATSNDWSALKNLAHSLSSIKPSSASKIISSWPPEQVATMLHTTNPAFFDYADWFLGAAVGISPDWCSEVGRFLDSRILAARVSLSEPGNIIPIGNVLHIFNKTGTKIYRSALRTLTTAMAKLLKNVHLENLYFPHVFPDLMLLSLYPEDVRAALSCVDVIAIARAYEVSMPRDWSRLADISMLARGCGSDLPYRIADAVQPDMIAATADRFSRYPPHETIALLYQLSNASGTKRRAFAERLLPLLVAAYKTLEYSRNQLLEGFWTLNNELFPVLCERIGIPVPSFDPLGDALAPSWRSMYRDVKKVEKRIAELENLGEDYDVSQVIA